MSISIRLNTNISEFNVLLNPDLESQKDVKVSAADTIILEDAPAQSIFGRIRSFFTGSSQVADKVSDLVKEKLREHIKTRFQVEFKEQDAAIDDVFDELLANSKISYRDLENAGKARQVMENIHDFVMAVHSDKADYLLKPSEIPHIRPEIVNVVNTLLGANFDTSLLSWPLVKAVVFSKDEDRMAEFRDALQVVLNKVYAKVSKENCSKSDESMGEALIGNILSYLPFTDPYNNKVVRVPQKINEKWEMVKYFVEVINITSEWLGDPVPALGLKPQDSPFAQPWLLFRGTPQPTASGSLPALASDAIPGYTVGEVIYNRSWAKEAIEKWVAKAYQANVDSCNKELSELGLRAEKVKISKGLKIAGQSLGGSLAIIAGCDLAKYVSSVWGYGAPSPLGSIRENYEERCKTIDTKPEFHLFWNRGDKIPQIGTGYHKDWGVYKIIVQQRQCSAMAHASANFAHPKAIVVRIDPVVDAESTARKVICISKEVLSAVMLPVTLTLLTLAFLKVVVMSACSKISEAAQCCLRICVSRRRYYPGETHA